MKIASEAVIALVVSLALTFADRFFVSGPYMGVAGILLSTVAALAGWYLAKATALALYGSKRAAAGYSMAPLAGFTMFGAIVFGALAYIKLFDLTKIDYTRADVAWHLLLVLLAAFTIKMAASSVSRLS